MKTFATALLIAALAGPASAATVWDEGSNGDLSSNAAAPTAIVLSIGSNDVIGTINGNPLDRDYLTFTIPPSQILSHLTLVVFSPNNLAFASFNAGATSFVPSGATNGSFLSGIHLDSADVGDDLMPYFDTRNVTTNSLPSAQLGPGTYSFLIQQTSPLVQNYHLDFIIEGTIATEATTWGKVKSLYR